MATELGGVFAKPGDVNGRTMISEVIIALILIPSTTVVELPDTEIVRRGNFVIAATVDGFLCYGTKTPRSVSCHRAVQLTQFGESIMLIGRSYQAEDLPREAGLSVTDEISHYTHPLGVNERNRDISLTTVVNPTPSSPHYSRQSRQPGIN